jgi:hypothetical protein
MSSTGQPPPQPSLNHPNRSGPRAGHSRSVQRIITQNLVLSAITAERSTGPVSMAAIEDLSALINVVVLYDELYVLGRADELHFSASSDLVDFLADERIIRAESFDPSTEEQVATAAGKHLLHFLGSNDIEDTRDYKALLRYFLSPGSTAACYQSMAHRPDGQDDIRLGELWFQSAPAKVDLLAELRRQEAGAESLGATFFSRTFLYLGYSNLRSMPLMVDSARSGLVRTVLEEEDLFYRTRVLAALQDSFEQHPREGERKLRHVVSPFAAIVFERANGDRSRIVKEVQELRRDLAGVRRDLGTLEFDSHWGQGQEKDDAERKIEGVLEEIKRSYGPHPGRFTLKAGLSFVEEVGKTAAQPSNPAAWVRLLSTPLEALRQVKARRTVAAIHELKGDLPGPFSLRADIEDLFGFIAE